MRKLTTSQAAMVIGISRQALYGWIRLGKIVPPDQTWVGAASFRFWGLKDIERVKAYKRNHRPRPGRPKGSLNGNEHSI
jgi:hypothetical protein